ncbi:ATP-dependent Clp protease proteolytic subunit [Dehalococcoidia bacterium]|nr:ATP-dependent Clp protease proteolytic subunit [Dehalococcoidia bacterium]
MDSQSKRRSKEDVLSTLKDIPEFPSKIVNVKAEEDQYIAKLANDKKVALIAFIAPYVSVRVSPVEEARAFITFPDEFGVEALLRDLISANIKNAYLLVNSPGGVMDSSYKIARAIRSKFNNITTFVPHVAASGGTLLALIGNEIVMGPMSHLTPLDVQIRYKGSMISAATFMKFFSRASKWFERMAPEEAPYPRKALTDKLDPFLMEEWSGWMDTAIDYVSDVLGLAGYENNGEIAQRIVMGFSSHDYVINYEKAHDIGLNVKNAVDFHGTWDVMRYWLSKYMLEQEVTHCIRYALPSGGDENDDSTEKENRNEPQK